MASSRDYYVVEKLFTMYNCSKQIQMTYLGAAKERNLNANSSTRIEWLPFGNQLIKVVFLEILTICLLFLMNFRTFLYS